MDKIDCLNQRRINDLKSILTASKNLSFEEIEEIIYRAGTLLHKFPRVIGIEGLIKKITVLKKRNFDRDSFESIYNHINELNLIYFFSVNKRMSVAVERKARPDNNKSIDILLDSGKRYYIEVKNLNKPKFTLKEFDFLNHLKNFLNNHRIDEPYRVHINILNDKSLNFKISQIDFILDKLKKFKNNQGGQTDSSRLNFWFFPNRNSPVFSFAFAPKPESTPLELDTFYMSSNRLDFSIKKRIIEGIKDTEEKFLDSRNGAVNILAVPIGEHHFANAVADIKNWYYEIEPMPLRENSGDENLEADPLLEHYDLYSRVIHFHRKKKIDAIVTLKGKGLLEKYDCEILSLSSALSEEVSGLFQD